MTDQFIEAGFIPIKPTDPDPFIEAGFIPIQPTQPTQPASPYAERTARAVAKKPEVPGTFLGDIGLAAKAIGTGVYSAAFDVFPKIMAEAIRGGDITVNDANTTLDRWIKEQKKDLERWDMPEHEKNRKLFGILKAQDLQSGLQNLGYSAAIGVAGMIPGAKIGAAIGGALGSPTGPGAAATAGIGAIIGGAIGAAATTAPVAYRATKDQFLADMLDRALAQKPDLTEEEWKGMREALEKDAQAYAFWEAAPETVGNMLSAALIKTPVGTYIKRIPNIKNAIGRVLAKAGVKIGLDIPVEVGTETITGIKQATIETKVGLREEDPTAAETFWEVLPPTLVTTIAGMGMGSAADSVSSIRQERSFYNRLQKAGYAKDTIKQIVRKIGFDDSAVYLAETHQDILKQALQADVPPSVMGDMRDSLTPGLVLNTYNQASENGKNESAGIRAVEELTGSKQYRFLQAQLRDAMLTKREQPAAEPAAEPEPTPAVEPETAPAVETVVEPAIEPTPTPEPRLVNVPAIQVADEDIALRPKLMQFKEIEEPLTGTTAQHKETIGGEWDDIKAGTLLLWEPINPKEHDLAPGQKYIVADGHGRVNWARKQEVKPQGFNAQILREADGFTAVEARIMAAVKNIADGKGTIYDQVKVLRNIAGTRGKTEADVFANREGIRGRNAAIIAFDSGNSLHDAFINEQVKPETAALIAKTAPDNDALQRLGLRFALDRQKDAVIEASMNAAQKASEAGRIPTAKQTDMFADTSLDEEWKRQGKIIAAEKTKLKERLLGRKAILKRYEETTATGSVLADKKRVADEVAKIESELARWEEWQLHDDLSAIVNPKEITDIVKTEVKPTPVPAPTPPPTPTPTPAAKPVARTAELTPRQYEERIAKIETEIMKRGKPLELLAIQNEASNRGLSDQEYLSLLEKWWNKQQKPEQPAAPAPKVEKAAEEPAPLPRITQEEYDADMAAFYKKLNRRMEILTPSKMFMRRAGIERAIRSQQPFDAESLDMMNELLRDLGKPEMDTSGYVRDGDRYVFKGEAVPAEVLADYPDLSPKAGVSLRSEKESTDERTFYRGTVPGETKRIDEPFDAAKGKTFVARKESSAKNYGESVEQIRANPDAKILREEDAAFWKLTGRKRPPNGYIGSALRKGERIVDAVNDAIRKAELAGYDILSFASDSDIGTIILNESSVTRGYVREGDRYVFKGEAAPKPVDALKAKMKPSPKAEKAGVPTINRDAGVFKTKTEAQQKIADMVVHINRTPAMLKRVKDAGLSVDALMVPVMEKGKWYIGMTPEHVRAAQELAGREQQPAPAPETKTSSTQPEQITPPPPSTITQTREAEQAISETEARVGAPSPQVEQLINDNLQRASDMSRRFNIPNLTDEDKFSIARAALVEAANNFDPSKGRFDLWASNAIRNALIDAYRKQIKESDVISLQGEISGQSEKTLQDIIPDWNEKTPEAQAQERDLLDNMHAVISGLDANDMEVVGAIQNNEPLRTLAEKRGISITEMFRQKQAALERVRTALEAKGIDRQAINKLFTQRSPQISMSQANTSATPVTPTVKVEQAQRRIDNWISKQANMPGVIVVQKVEDAAQFGLSESSMSLLRNSNPRGFFWESGNQVVVIADGLRSVDDALEVVLHEAIGHYGVGQVLGKDFDSAMLKLSNEISDADLMKVAADYYNALPDQGLDNPLDSEANRIYLASEYVAINAQNQPTLWQKFVELVRKALGKIMPTTYVNALVKRGGVESIVQASRNYVRGSEYGGIENYLSRMEQPDIRMSVAQPSLFGEEKGKSSLRLDLEAIAALPVGTVQAGVGRQAQAERSLLQFESINKAKELLTRLDKNEIAESEAGQQWADHMSESMKQQARIARREARAGEALGKRQAELFGEPQAQETLRLSVSPPRANPVTDEPTRSLYREMERDYKPGHVGKTEMQARAQSQIDNELQHKNMATLLAETSVKGFTTEPEATLRAQILLNTPEFARLFNGTPDQIDTAISLVTQTLNQGTRTARSMAYRVDQMETPMQRQVMILKLLASPPSKVFKNWHSMTPEAQKAHLDQHRARMKRAIAFLKTKGIHDITKVPEAILSDDQKLAEVINAISQQFASTGDKVYEYWRNSILSGLHTNVVNVTSNFGMSTWEMFVQRPAEALLNMFVKNPMAPTFASLAAAYKQIFPNIHNANLALIKSFQTETGMYSAIDTKGETAIAGKKGRVIRAPQRALLSIDEWFKTILVKSLSYDYATRIADKNKLTGIGRAAYIEWAANDTTGESVVPEEAINEAERILFQTKPGAVGRAILSARNEKGMVGWAFKYLFPFVTTPTNLIKIGIKKSPFGLLNVGLEGIAALRGKDSRYAGDYGKAALITDVVEQAFAWSLAGLLYSWTAPGGDDDEDYLPRITGTVAGTPNERRFKMRNIPAHSIRIGDRWYSYARAEPLSNVLTLTVDALTSLHDVRAGKGLDANDAKKFLSLIKDKTYLQTLGDLMRGIENPEDWTNLAQNFSSSWMPNLFKQAMRATDPMQRDYRVREKGLAFLGKSFIARGLQKAVPLPIESMQPIARIDHWGRPVSKDVQFFGLPQSDIVWRLVVPSTVQNITNMTNIDRMIFNWNRAQTDDAKQWWPGNVRPKIKIRGHEWEMNDDQFEQYQIMRGQMALDIAQRIKWNFNNPTAHHMKVLEKIFERSGRVARLKVLRDILEENRFDRINKG